MKRRNFLQLAGAGAGAMMLPFDTLANSVPEQALLAPWLDLGTRKQLADVGLNTARSASATYADVRIGRYLNQFVVTRENKVQNVRSTESYGVGVRVIANGNLGFASTNDVTPDGIKKATERADAIAKANSKFQKEPVIL